MTIERLLFSMEQKGQLCVKTVLGDELGEAGLEAHEIHLCQKKV
jgi:hypothetical protein